MIRKRVLAWVLDKLAYAVDNACVLTGHRFCHRFASVAFKLWAKVDKLEEGK
jgi:hypothetical protein